MSSNDAGAVATRPRRSQVGRIRRSATSRRDESAARLSVLTVGLDAHTADEVRRALPDARIANRDRADDDVETVDADIVVVDLARGQVPHRRRDQSKVIGLLPLALGTRTAIDDAGVDVALQRPLMNGEFAETVRGLLGNRPFGPEPQTGWLRRAEWWIQRLRFVAIAWAAVVGIFQPGGEIAEAVILAAVLLYAILRMPLSSRPRVVVVDVLIVSALLVLTGGPASPYLLLAMLTAAEAGIYLRTLPAVGAGAVIVLGGLPGLASAEMVQPDRILVWIVLMPLAAAAASFASDVFKRERQEIDALLDANRLLRDLHDVARSTPARLDLRNVSDEATTAVQQLGLPAALLFVDDAGEAVLTGGYGHSRAEYRAFPIADLSVLVGDGSLAVRPREDLRAPLSRILSDHQSWVFVPLRHGQAYCGVLAVATSTGRVSGAQRRAITMIAEEAAVGIDSARTFARVRELALDVERWRLAGDLHDGVAQGLAHVRLELDLLRRQRELSAEEVREELQRIKRVTERALRDVREMVDGLRATAAGSGLAAALHEHVRDFGGRTTPSVRFDARRDPKLDRDVERHVYRIAQEAISNALRHAGATSIAVVLDVADGVMSLRIDDDGRGIDELTPDVLRGIGLRSMEERAERIGGVLEVAALPEGGTRVELRMQTAEAAANTTTRGA